MRRLWPLAGVLILLTMCAPSAHAGVYSSLEPKFKLNDQYFNVFRDESLFPLRQIGTEYVQHDWQKFYALMGTGLDLSKLVPSRDPSNPKTPEPLTVEQRLSLGVCLLRLRRPQDAIQILRPFETRMDKGNFLAVSTLGTAYFLVGEYSKAGDLLSDASKSWAKPLDDLGPRWPGTTPPNNTSWKDYLARTFQWDANQFSWLKTCEGYQRKLVRLRGRELKKAPLTFDAAFDRLDPLFDADKSDQPLRFVGESGKFDVGKIAPAEKAKLPKDAILIVQQLLIWTPDDYRLYWLLGELLNAQGEAESAKVVFEDFLNKFAQKKESGLQAVYKPGDIVPKINPERYLPEFVATFPQVGPQVQALHNYKREQPADVPLIEPKNEQPVAPPPPAPDTSLPKGPAVGALAVDWQTLAVGFGSGLLAGVFVAWQWRELRRRRLARPLPAPHEMSRWAKPTGASDTNIRPEER